MRKVYQNEKSSTGFAMAVFFAVGLTAILFATLPFAHRIARSERSLELRKTSATDLPPPEKDETPPPPVEENKPPEAPPEPQLADVPQQIPLSADLEVAAGSGGGLAGFGEIRALTAAQAIQDETFDVSELEKQPEAVSQVSPVYPRELSKAKIDGTVKVLFVIDENGRVEDPRIDSASRPEFEKPALDAIRKWRFHPGMKDGQPVRTYRSIRFPFRVRTG